MKKKAYVIVGVTNKAGASQYAKGYRRALKQAGKYTPGRVKVVKTVGGYVAIDTKRSH